METVMFVLENKNLLLKLLGFSYGRIFFDGCHTRYVCTIDAADNILKKAVELDLVDDEGAAKIKQQMVEANVAPDIGKLCDAIREYKVDEDFKPSYKFVSHEGCPYPLPHGVVVDKEGAPLSDKIHDLEEGLSIVLAMADTEKYNGLDCVDIFKQMLALGLPINEAVIEQQLKELPPEKRGQDDNTHFDSMLDMIAELLNTSNITIVEIKLERRADKPTEKPNTDTPDQPEASPKA